MKFQELFNAASKISTEKQWGKYASSGSVASALLTSKGNIYTGVCVNVSCGIGFCAEHSAIAEMLKGGESEIKEILAVKGSAGNAVIPSCGRCRELMFQINPNNKDTIIYLSEGRSKKLSELLPEHWLTV